MRTPCLVAGSGAYLTHLIAARPRVVAAQRAPPEAASMDYSPQDLVLTVGAGMTLHAVQELLREHRQYLPWNPALPQQATLGGIVSSNRAGSWRYRFGTPRDRLLAARAVTPDGVAFKSGAKVVKSVAGYDIHRLLCGAWGTLAVLTEITLKVQPLPQHFEAVGWKTSWDALEPTLTELMQMPLQPDGISVLAMRNPDVGVCIPATRQSLSPPP
jgi:glycolate oxidase FAD binding subunit